jgi:hypothetical protein
MDQETGRTSVAATKGGQEMLRGKPEQAEQIIPKLREVEVELGRGQYCDQRSFTRKILNDITPSGSP